MAGDAETLARLVAGELRELLQTIQEESEYLTRLVHNVLQMTRLESAPADLHREWHSLEEIVGAALARCERALGDRPVQTDLPPDLPLVFVDDVLIEQVLINLLDNVSKYTPPGSPVEISARASARAVEVRVADRGPGFSPGAETRLFEKFHRGKTGGPRGVGLGLAICRAIVEAHDGKIWAQNRPGGGALFGFTLPLKEAQPQVHTADG
jgi:two-component system sensor histidine kinase KdpD